MKKKILSFVLAICVIIPCALVLTACGKSTDDSSKVMNVSLNPKLEFVLDKDDKVVSVNALNEDGNHIISISMDEETAKSLFEGMTAEEAIELFLEITEDNGYLITGNEEEIKIEVSGDADKLIEKVKDKANKFFTDKGLNINIATEKLDKADIEEKVKQCMKEYTDAELDQMTQEELVELLKNSRKETKNLFTQELKDAYYNMRVEKINLAELDALLTVIEGLDNIPGIETILQNLQIPNVDDVSALFSEFKTNMATLKTQIEALETAYNENFLAESSAYNVAKDEYIAAKKQLLDARKQYKAEGISETEKQALAELETVVENAKTALEQAKQTADLAIATAKEQLQTAFNTVKEGIETIKNALTNIPGIDLGILANAKHNVKEGFKNHFENHDFFGEHVGHDKGHWEHPAP